MPNRWSRGDKMHASIEPKGSGFVARHGEDFLLANNAQWVGFSMEIGPAGDSARLA